MAVNHSIVALNDTTPVAVSVTGNHAGRDLTIQNISEETVFIGGANVSTTNYGFKLNPDDAWSVELAGGDTLYAVASANASVAVLQLSLEVSD